MRQGVGGFVSFMRREACNLRHAGRDSCRKRQAVRVGPSVRARAGGLRHELQEAPCHSGHSGGRNVRNGRGVRQGCGRSPAVPDIWAREMSGMAGEPERAAHTPSKHSARGELFVLPTPVSGSYVDSRFLHKWLVIEFSLTVCAGNMHKTGLITSKKVTPMQRHARTYAPRRLSCGSVGHCCGLRGRTTC